MGGPPDPEPSRDELLDEIESLRARVRDLEHVEIERQGVEAALRKREAKLSMMVGLAKDAFITTDSSERIVLFNRAAERAFGYDAGEIIGQPLSVLLPAQYRDRHSAHLKSFEQSNVPARYMGERPEIFCLRKDGAEFPAEASISVFHLAGETYFTAVLRDVTERKEAEEALRQSKMEMKAYIAELQDARERYEGQSIELAELCEDLSRARDHAVYANHAKSQFLAHMSHEIRTPLTAILGFSEVIGDEVFGPLSPPKYGEYVQDIYFAGTHLLELINDILNLAKIEAGKLEIQDGEIEIATAVSASLRFVKERASRGGLEITTAVEDDLPLLRADERMVKQMLINLLTNAVKFTRRGGRISVQVEIGQRGILRLSVRDTGIGIAEQDIPKVLEAFGQADNAGSGSPEGTGLGLPLVKSMIELHGGALELESQVDAGTTVTICFPPERLLPRQTAQVA